MSLFEANGPLGLQLSQKQRGLFVWTIWTKPLAVRLPSSLREHWQERHRSVRQARKGCRHYPLTGLALRVQRLGEESLNTVESAVARSPLGYRPYGVHVLSLQLLWQLRQCMCFISILSQSSSSATPSEACNACR